MNQLAIRAFNGLYYRKHGNRQMLMVLIPIFTLSIP